MKINYIDCPNCKIGKIKATTHPVTIEGFKITYDKYCNECDYELTEVDLQKIISPTEL